MKKLLAITMIFLSGCATTKLPSQYLLDKQANRTIIENSKKIELFYHSDHYMVVDLGGSEAKGLLDSNSRTDRRSEEFSKKIKDNLPDQHNNRDFAQKLANLLAKRGHETKITQISMPEHNKDKRLISPKDLVPTEGYLQLILGLGTYYGAASETDTFKPVIVVDYTLKDPTGKNLMSNSQIHIHRDSGKTYLTYAALLADNMAASEELRALLNSWSVPIYNEIFSFADASSAK